MTVNWRMALGIVGGMVIVSVPVGVAFLGGKRPPAETHQPAVARSLSPPPEGHPATSPAAVSPKGRVSLIEPQGSEPVQTMPSEPISEARSVEDEPPKVPESPRPGRQTRGPVETAGEPKARQRVQMLDHPPGLPTLAHGPPEVASMTPLAGRHVGGLVLRQRKSPYLLTGRCEVLGQLDLECGVEVWLLAEKYPKAKLIVQGPVRAQGRVDKPILFAAAKDPTVGPLPVILESPAIGRPDAPEGWVLRYVGLVNCSLIGVMRGGQSSLSFCRMGGELRLESEQGGISVADCWFETADDLIISGATLSVERVIAAGREGSARKKFIILTAERLKVKDCRLEADFLRLLDRPGQSASTMLTGNIFRSGQMTMGLGKRVEPRVWKNSFYLDYRLQVVGRAAEYPSAVKMQENFWAIRAPDQAWPYGPGVAGDRDILAVEDQPRLERPVEGYVWKASPVQTSGWETP